MTLPLTAPSNAGVCIPVLGLSLDEFIIANFVIGANTTVPTYVFSEMLHRQKPWVPAFAAPFLFTSLSLLALAIVVSRAQKSRALPRSES